MKPAQPAHSRPNKQVTPTYSSLPRTAELTCRVSHTPTISGDWDSFYDTVEAVATADVPAPLKCPLDFKFMIEAASNNASTPEAYGFYLEAFIKHHPGSTASYGSELRPISQLQPLLCHHPHFARFEHNHIHGIN